LFGSFDSDIMQKQGLVLEWSKRRNRWWEYEKEVLPFIVERYLRVAT